MGWGSGATDEYGREIGYAIQATCDRRGCDAVFDRGLGYVCGGDHGGERGGCGRYFCGEHSCFVGPRGGCSHHFSGAYGVTFCQPMMRGDGEVYCACHFDHYVEWPEDQEALTVAIDLLLPGSRSKREWEDSRTAFFHRDDVRRQLTMGQALQADRQEADVRIFREFLETRDRVVEVPGDGG